jgi:hypothetical protein
MTDARMPGGHERIEFVDRETNRYIGPVGQADFLATVAIRGGEIIRRGGRVVAAVDVSSIRWTGDRAGEAMSDLDRDRILGAIRRQYGAERAPYQLRHPSGVLEDETGARRPGFRSALPHAEHSEGWSLTDAWMSPEYPDPDSYPPAIVYSDAAGAAELPRRIEVRGDRRLRVLDSRRLEWIGARSAEAMTDGDRDRIIARVRSVYDEWGYHYEVEAG